MEESNFPRGNSLTSADVLITPFEVKKVHKLAERDLWSGRSTAKKSKRSGKSEEVDFEDSLDFLTSAKASADILTVKALVAGMLFVAKVKEIHDTEMVVSLPNGLVGYVSINEVSDLFSNALKSLSQEDADDEEEMPHLNEFFHVGQTVVTVITKLESVEKADRVSKRIECSIKPAVVNSYLPHLTRLSAYTGGLTLWCQVSSIEDKGYFLDCGVKVASKSEGDLKFFLPALSSLHLQEGTLLLATVVERTFRIVKMSLDPVTFSAISGYDQVCPGLCVEGTVAEIQKRGAVIEFGNGLKGTVDLFRFEQHILSDANDTSLLSFPVSVHSPVKANVAYVDAVGKRIGLSLQYPDFVSSQFDSCDELLSQFSRIGQKVNAKVVRIDPLLGIMFQLEDESFAYCTSNRLSDDSSYDISKFSVGSVHQARILDFSLMDRAFSISLQQSQLAVPFIRCEDALIGSIMKGTIRKILPTGAVVALTDSICGFCPILWSSDAKNISGKNPLTKYNPGQTVKVRIIKVVPEEKKIVVTCKRSLLSSDIPVITTLEQAVPGTVAMGVVTNIKEYGCFVSFFSDITGLVPLKEMGWTYTKSPADVVFVGKTVKCRILERNDNQLLLTLKVDKPTLPQAQPTSATKSTDAKSTDIASLVGTTVSAKVTKIVPSRGLAVSFSLQKRVATGLVHLSDLFDEPIPNPLSSFYPGQTISAVIVEVKKKKGKLDYFLSVKPSVLEGGNIAQTIAPPLLGDKVIGHVATINDGGVFVNINRHLDGRVMIKELSVDYVKDWKSICKLGDLVTCKVIAVSDNGRYELSIKAWQEEQLNISGLKVSRDTVKVDQQYECIVTTVQPYGIFLKILGSNPPVTGCCRTSNIQRLPLGKSQYEQGDYVTATVIKLGNERKKVTFAIQHADSQPVQEEERPCEELPSVPMQQEEKLDIVLQNTGFDWKCSSEEQSEQDACESEDSELYDSDEETGKKVGKKRITKKQRLLHEEMITKQEEFLTESLATGPRDEQDFQRACTSTPHDPLIYVQFMNWYLRKNLLDQARIVARTALKRIPLDMQQPRQIVWLALLSAENLYGTEESLEKTLQEARQCNDEKSLLITFARILYTNGGAQGHRRAESVYALLVKRFSQSLKCWKLRSLFYFLTKHEDQAREIQKQAMRQLPAHKHLKAGVQWALMEQKHGSIERSRTHFETLLASHPKRLDVWMIYWQSEQDPAAKYVLLERVASIKWSVHKSKLVYKTWLEAAKQLPTSGNGRIGREEAIQKVKNAAKRYVESLQ